MAFYERYEWLCEEKGVTPSQAARDAGIRQSVVSMWKKRGSTPSGSTLTKLAKYFDVSTDFLLGKVIDAKIPGSAAGLRFLSGSGGNSDEKLAKLIYQPITPLTKENLAIMAREQFMVKSFRKLNSIGQSEAMKRIGELTEIPRYRAEPPTTLTLTEGKDTTPAEPPPESAEKDG